MDFELRSVEMRILNDHLRNNPELWPQGATSGSAAYDLRACLDESLILQPGETQAVKSGIALHIGNPNYYGLVVPRSGLGSKHGLVLANTAGIIDSDYTGELTMFLLNRGKNAFTIEPYMRVCQLLVQAVMRPNLKMVENFSAPSTRGANGFGSTGTD